MYGCRINSHPITPIRDVRVHSQIPSCADARIVLIQDVQVSYAYQFVIVNRLYYHFTNILCGINRTHLCTASYSNHFVYLGIAPIIH